MKDKRIAWLDYARTAAILCVVLCHAAETYYRPILLGRESAGSLRWLWLTILFTIGRLGVPIFLALTGALMLGRELSVRSFYRRHLLPLWVTTELWIALGYGIFSWYQGTTFHWRTLARQMLFLENSSMGHLWYMPMILSVYVVLPFLSRIVVHTEQRGEYRLWFWLGVTALSVIPSASAVLQQIIPGMQPWNPRWDTSAWGGIYLLYLFAGWCIARKEVLDRFSGWLIALVGIGAFALNTLGQRFLYLRGAYEVNKLVTYTSTGIFVAGLCLLEGIRRAFQKKTSSSYLVLVLANTSFGIYLIHKPLQMAIKKVVLEGSLGGPLTTAPVWAKTLVLFFGSLLPSILVVAATARWLPPLGKLFFGSKTVLSKKGGKA